MSTIATYRFADIRTHSTTSSSTTEFVLVDVHELAVVLTGDVQITLHYRNGLVVPIPCQSGYDKNIKKQLFIAMQLYSIECKDGFETSLTDETLVTPEMLKVIQQQEKEIAEKRHRKQQQQLTKNSVQSWEK
jgi:hypothetical protein